MSVLVYRAVNYFCRDRAWGICVRVFAVEHSSGETNEATANATCGGSRPFGAALNRARRRQGHPKGRPAKKSSLKLTESQTSRDATSTIDADVHERREQLPGPPPEARRPPDQEKARRMAGQRGHRH